MYTDIHFELFAVLPVYSNLTSFITVHSMDNRAALFSCLGTQSKFSRVVRKHIREACKQHCVFLVCRKVNMASVVPLPGTKQTASGLCAPSYE